MDSIELLARFALEPNRRGCCGPLVADVLRGLIVSKDVGTVRETLFEFPTLKNYLEVIAQVSGKEKEDYSVIEAYVLGNELLDKFTQRGFFELVSRFAITRKWEKQVEEYIAVNLPSRAVPHHSFDVLYMGRKGIGVTEGDLGTINKCLVTWAEVEEIHGDRLGVKYFPLIYGENGFDFAVTDTHREIAYDSGMLPGIAKRDKVAVHWDFAFMKLDDRQEHNLKKYTKQNMDAVNSLYKV